MKIVLSIAVMGFLAVSSNAWASDGQDTFTALDNELPNGLTVAQTLAEWDKSSMRYYSEPPVAPGKQKSQRISEAAKAQENNKS